MSRISRADDVRGAPPGALGSVVAACLALALATSLAATGQEPESPTEETLLGSASALRIETDDGRDVLIEAGTKLHEQPHRHAAVVSVVDVELRLSPLETRNGWVRVRFGDRVGWAALGDGAAAPEPPAPRPDPAPPSAPLALEKLTPDATRLTRALGLLGETAEPLDAEPFHVYTDVRSRRKRELAVETARRLADAYRERYGLSPQREASFAAVIFERERDYRTFEDSVTNLGRLDAEGHAGSGVAALHAAGRTPTEVAALLIHELTHLLNRRAFSAPLPPWLEEGIANDLAYCRVDSSGRLVPGSLGGRGFIAEVPGPPDRFGRRRFSGTIQIEGPLASLSLLQRAVAAGESLPLPELLDLTWREFVDPKGRELRYVQSTFFVRYLLDELEGGGFRRFLSDFQAGGSAGALELLAALGLGWEELTAGFERWVERHGGGS